MRDSQNGCLSFENLNLKWMITRGTPMAEETSNWPATNISTRSTACLSPGLLIIASSSLALPAVGADDTAQCNNGADLPGCWMVLSFCFDMCHMPVPVTVLQHVIKYFEQYVCIYVYVYVYNSCANHRCTQKKLRALSSDMRSESKQQMHQPVLLCTSKCLIWPITRAAEQQPSYVQLLLHSVYRVENV